MNILKFLFRIEPLEDKDPKDNTLTPSSTGWRSDDTYCPHCLKSTGHNEFMSDICNSCGTFGSQIRFGRVYRKIVQAGKWVYQIRYQDGKEEIRDNWY